MASTYHHGDLRSALLAAAGAVLEAKGADAVTFRGLARELNVSHAAPGYHFADRQALLVELAGEGHALLEQSMRSSLNDVEQSDRNEQLAAIGRGYLRFALVHPNRFRLMFAGVADCDISVSELFVSAGAASFATLVQVSSGSADPEEHPAAWLRAWALVHGLATLRVDRSLESLSESQFLDLSDEILSRP